jgi:hypothetical protein
MGAYFTRMFAPSRRVRRTAHWPATYFGYTVSVQRVNPEPSSVRSVTPPRRTGAVSTIPEGARESITPDNSGRSVNGRLTTAQRQSVLGDHRDAARLEMLGHEIMCERRAVDQFIRELGVRQASVKFSTKSIADECGTSRR